MPTVRSVTLPENSTCTEWVNDEHACVAFGRPDPFRRLEVSLVVHDTDHSSLSCMDDLDVLVIFEESRWELLASDDWGWRSRTCMTGLRRTSQSFELRRCRIVLTVLSGSFFTWWHDESRSHDQALVDILVAIGIWCKADSGHARDVRTWSYQEEITNMNSICFRKWTQRI